MESCRVKTFTCFMIHWPHDTIVSASTIKTKSECVFSSSTFFVCFVLCVDSTYVREQHIKQFSVHAFPTFFSFIFGDFEWKEQARNVNKRKIQTKTLIFLFSFRKRYANVTMMIILLLLLLLIKA